jgi:hypothetical protein
VKVIGTLGEEVVETGGIQAGIAVFLLGNGSVLFNMAYIDRFVVIIAFNSERLA